MKVTPSQIEFTLPSPKLGVESMPVIDPPWEPRCKPKITQTIQARGQVRKRLIFIQDRERFLKLLWSLLESKLSKA